MNKIYIKARAKINLTLEVLNKREDGYHNLKSVFQKVSLYDKLYIYKTNSDSLELITDIEELNNKDNILYKAYVKLKERYDNITGMKVVLKKKILMQAGLGGGSSDCASFILGVNQLFDLKMREDEIIALGRSLGSDIVPCLYDRAVLAEGIGDVITVINTNFKYYIVIIKPELSCKTAEMFEKLDMKNREIVIENSDNVIKALENNNIELLASNLYNSFESVLDLKEIKDALIENKALSALLTGSGSCVFGIFKNRSDAKSAYINLKKQYNTYMCTSYNSSRVKKCL